MNTVTVKVEPRSETGKRKSRLNRQDGSVPSVLYGKNQEPVHCTVTEADLRKALKTERKRNIVFKLEGLSGSPTVMLKDLQVHPVNDHILHADFVRIEAESMVVVDVAMNIVGESPGVVQQGGAVDRPLRSLRIKTTPDNIPLSLDISIEGLWVGQSVAAGAVPLPAGCSLVTRATVSVAVIAATRATRLMGAGEGAAS